MTRASLIAAATSLVAGTPCSAQTIPFADTEDATLSEVDVRSGRVHPILTLDVRNGDYARGAYDDDDADFGRVPVHLAIGGAITLRGGTAGQDGLFLIGQSSNGFHAPTIDERDRPRAWYESNNLLGIAWRRSGGLSVATTYTIKTSPNGVAATTHEISLTTLYGGNDALGALKPKLAITKRTRGEGGVYTIAGISPSFELTDRDHGPTLALPILVGVGWDSFYAKGSGTRAYGSGGLTFSQPVKVGGARASLQAELLALFRDDRLRRLDAPGGTIARLVPYATISLRFSY